MGTLQSIGVASSNEHTSTFIFWLVVMNFSKFILLLIGIFSMQLSARSLKSKYTSEWTYDQTAVLSYIFDRYFDKNGDGLVDAKHQASFFDTPERRNLFKSVDNGDYMIQFQEFLVLLQKKDLLTDELSSVYDVNDDGFVDAQMQRYLLNSEKFFTKNHFEKIDNGDFRIDMDEFITLLFSKLLIEKLENDPDFD